MLIRFHLRAGACATAESARLLLEAICVDQARAALPPGAILIENS
jgi:hypothetical protein